jgi:hypothetical protein
VHHVSQQFALQVPHLTAQHYNTSQNNTPHDAKMR